MTEQELSNEVEATILLYEKHIPTSAIATRAMIERYQLIPALKRLVQSAEIQKGFKTLCNHNLVDKTFESLVVKYGNLFDSETVRCAQFRLDNYKELAK